MGPGSSLLSACSLIAYGGQYPQLLQSVAVELRTLPSPCIAIVSNGQEAGDFCSKSSLQAPLSSAQVGDHA